jgi:hypothetical protein
MPKTPPTNPRHPNRPKIKFKRVGRKPPPPPKTKEEIAAKQIAKLEQRHKINPSKVSLLLLKERGTITGVARLLKVPRATLLRYIEKHDECMEALTHAREAMGDKAESKLFELIDQGDVRCILYYLSTVHRHRGYGLRSDDDNSIGNGRGPVFVETVNVIGVPSGTFLPKEAVTQDSMVIDN